MIKQNWAEHFYEQQYFLKNDAKLDKLYSSKEKHVDSGYLFSKMFLVF